MRYRRVWVPGGIYFFTLVTHGRRPLLTEPANLTRLGAALRRVRARYPFSLDAVVVLPDHLHCIMALPRNDHDFAVRWRLIKSYFTRVCIGADGVCPPSRSVRKERSVWQRRFWEHWIRDQADWRRHMDYVHYNPVKHGYAARAADWRPSSIHRYIRDGVYPPDWGGHEPPDVAGMEFE